MKIPIARPCIGEEEIKRVVEVLKSGMLAQGREVEEFERSFADYIGVGHAVAVCNGTVALDLVLKALGIGSGDEIITTSFTFVATANSILYQGAKPIFADIDERTYNISPDDVIEKINPRTKAIVAVHLFGHPFDIKAFMEICEDHNLFLIEDAAQAHGAEYNGEKVGKFGIGCFSFYPTKNLVTGEGGMITTNDASIAKNLRLLRNHGDAGKYEHVMLGYNYRMTDLQAAIGIEQLKKLEDFNEKRIENANYFKKKIRLEGLIHPKKLGRVKHVYHQYVVRMESVSRDELMRYLTERGVSCAVHYPKPIYNQPLYKKLGYDGKCKIAEDASRKVLSIPVHPALQQNELRYIVECINDFQ